MRTRFFILRTYSVWVWYVASPAEQNIVLAVSHPSSPNYQPTTHPRTGTGPYCCMLKIHVPAIITPTNTKAPSVRSYAGVVYKNSIPFENLTQSLTVPFEAICQRTQSRDACGRAEVALMMVASRFMYQLHSNYDNIFFVLHRVMVAGQFFNRAVCIHL